MQENDKIMLAGSRGLVGSAIGRRLAAGGYENVIGVDRAEADLTNQAETRELLLREKPAYLFIAAARVGGILANSTYPADFIRDNLLIQTNLIDAALEAGVTKLLFLGSSCIYPKHAPQPMKEEHLLTSPLEPTNEWYAIAKIAGIKMVQAYRKQHGLCGISLMPTNLYGPGDNFDLETSHVLPAMIRKFHEAKQAGAPEVVIWGTGEPRRELLYVDDLADAAVFLMETYDEDPFINVGVGEDVTIGELARLVGEVVGYEGALTFDTSKPDGTPRKLLDVSRLTAAGWKAKTPLREGIEATYRWYLAQGR